VKVRHLYISSGHNYFGHHGRPAGSHPILEVPAFECVAGRGIRGDRFFDFKENYQGQITFFALEVHHELCRELKLSGPSAAGYRRNVITEGVDLNLLIGSEFEVQGVRFCGMVQCAPCYWMDEAFAPGAEQFLKGRGGLRAAILTNGILFTGK
jgi:hypothetical protein